MEREPRDIFSVSDSKSKSRVVRLLLHDKDKQFYESEIAKKIAMSPTAVSNALDELVRIAMVNVVPAGPIKLYSLNSSTWKKVCEETEGLK